MQQQLLAGFGLGPNLRFLRIAKTNQKVSDIAFKAQIIATVTQICDLYWDLVSAYDEEQVGERSVEFAQQTLDTSRKQLELQAIPEMEVLKAEGELANREQDLTVSRTNLELQELYMKNAFTRSLDDPILQEMPVVPVDHIASRIEPISEPVQEMIADALRNRTELQESSLVLQNSELSRKTARNALLPIAFTSMASMPARDTPAREFQLQRRAVSCAFFHRATAARWKTRLNYSSPEYQVGFQLNIPLRNRIAKADQYRTELEYRQSQVYLEELKKRIRIEVRNASYALEQGASRVDAARKARDLAAAFIGYHAEGAEAGRGIESADAGRGARSGLGRVGAGDGRDRLRKGAHRSEALHRLGAGGVRNLDCRRQSRRSGGRSSPVTKSQFAFWWPTISRTFWRPSSCCWPRRASRWTACARRSCCWKRSANATTMCC